MWWAPAAIPWERDSSQDSSCSGFVPNRTAEEVEGTRQEKWEMCIWCRRVVWCCWTSVCCELRGPAGRLGRGDSLLLPPDTRLSPHLWFPWLVPCDSSRSLRSPATRDASHPVGQHSARETWFARKISKCQLDGNVPPARNWLSPPISTDFTQMLLPLCCLHLPLCSTSRDLYLRDF